MDPMLLRVYQGQVAYCCRAVLFGIEDIQSSRAVETGRVWYGVQNLINGAGNAYKALWGIGNKEDRARRYIERQPLRDSVEVTDESPFRSIKVRDAYEHIDERIEKWWNTSADHNLADAIIGPPGTVGGNALGERNMLRWLDPVNGKVIFWGDELDVTAVVAEARRVLPIAVREASKPRW
jgi:hypothetical protein